MDRILLKEIKETINKRFDFLKGKAKEWSLYLNFRR